MLATKIMRKDIELLVEKASRDYTSDSAESNGKLTKRQQVEAYLLVRFRFRFNDLTGGVEFTPAARNNWEELTDYKLNSLCRQIDAEKALAVPAGSLIEYLRSDFVPAILPLASLFSFTPTTERNNGYQGSGKYGEG